MLHTVHLNGADAQKIADLMGGVLIMHNVTDDTATISGGDRSKLNPAKYYIKNVYSEGRGPTRRAHREYSQAFDTYEQAQEAVERFATMYPEFNVQPSKHGGYDCTSEEGERGHITIESLLSRPLEEYGDKLVTTHFTLEFDD